MYLALALIQAAVLWGLQHAIAAASWPATNPGVLSAFFLIFLFVPPVALVLWKHRRQGVLWKAVGGLAVFLALAGYFAFHDFPVPLNPADLDDIETVRFVGPLLLGWLLFLSLVHARVDDGSWHPPYPVLFRSFWGSLCTLAESLLFTGLFWILLFLWAALFDILGNPFFKTVFDDSRFAYPATTVVFAIATQIIGDNQRMVAAVVDQMLDLLKWLLPLAGIIVMAFTVAMAPKLPVLIGSGEKILNSAILLALVVVTILLINAAFRDGAIEPDYHPWLKQALRIIPALLTVVAATALYSLLIRTVELGLTPARFWGLITAGIACLFSAGYVYAARRSGPWFGGIAQINTLLAAALLLTFAASLTPLGDPLRWSIADQTQRAMTSASSENRDSALGFLRFEAGRQGRLALESIAAGDSASAREARAMLALTSRKKPERADPNATPERFDAWRRSLRTLPSTASVPDNLDVALRAEFMRSATTLDPGGNSSTPIMVFTDLNADGAADAVLIVGTRRGDPKIVRDYRIFIAENADWRLASKGSFSRSN